MRILQHSLNYPPDGNSTAWLEGELGGGLVSRGHDVVALTATPSANFDAESRSKQPFEKCWRGLFFRSQFKGVTVLHVSVPEKKSKVISRIVDYARFALLSLLVGAVKAGPADIVISVSPPLSIGVSGWMLACIRRCPHVYVVQEIYPDIAVSLGVLRNGRLIRLMEHLELFVYQRSVRVVVISEWFKTRLIEKGVPSNKITVIPNFVDSQLFLPMPRQNEFSAAHDLNDKFVLFYGGNIGLTQSLETLLEAADMLADLADIRLLITGGGGRFDWLQAQAESGTHPNVIVLPYQPRSIVPSIYASCDVGLVPLKAGTARETFPSKIYTIMSMGRPVIAAADPDTELNWIVSEANCGWAIPPDNATALAEAVREAHARRSELPTMGENGRRHVLAHNTVETVSAAYDALVKELTRQ